MNSRLFGGNSTHSPLNHHFDFPIIFQRASEKGYLKQAIKFQDNAIIAQQSQLRFSDEVGFPYINPLLHTCIAIFDLGRWIFMWGQPKSGQMLRAGIFLL